MIAGLAKSTAAKLKLFLGWKLHRRTNNMAWGQSLQRGPWAETMVRVSVESLMKLKACTLIY